MNMSIENVINRSRWLVVERLKAISDSAPKSQLNTLMGFKGRVEVPPHHVVFLDRLIEDRRRLSFEYAKNSVYWLQEQGAVKIFREQVDDSYLKKIFFRLAIHETVLLKIYKKFKRKYEASQNIVNESVNQRFYFSSDESVLHRGGYPEVLPIKQNSKEHALLTAALKKSLNMNSPNEAIDVFDLSEDGEITWDQLRDTARRLNKKISSFFGLKEDFFERGANKKSVICRVL